MFQLTTSLHYIFRTEQMGEWASFSTFAHHLGLSHAKLGVPRAIGWADVCADCKCWDETAHEPLLCVRARARVTEDYLGAAHIGAAPVGLSMMVYVRRA